MRYELTRNGDVYGIRNTLTGKQVLSDEGYNVAQGVLWHLNNPGLWTCAEVCEVAEAILDHAAGAEMEEHDA